MSKPCKGPPDRLEFSGQRAATGSDEYEIRAFRMEDLPGVLALFQESYGKSLDESFYRWRFLENPTGPVMILLAISGERIVSHYAVCPALSRDPTGANVRTAQSMTTMTHPDHAGRGLFTWLAEELYGQIAADYGVEIVFGFPNTNSHYGFREKLGWTDVELMSFLTRDTEGLVGGSFMTVPWDNLRDVLDAHAGTVGGWQPYRRNRENLRWRYEMCPTTEYIVIAPEEAEFPVAVVVKEYKTRHRVKELAIVDIIGDQSRQALLAAVDAALAFAVSRAFTQVSSWLDLFHPFRQALERRRFRVSGPVTYFGARPLNTKWNGCFDPRDWRITMGDSDVF